MRRVDRLVSRGVLGLEVALIDREAAELGAVAAVCVEIVGVRDLESAEQDVKNCEAKLEESRKALKAKLDEIQLTKDGGAYNVCESVIVTGKMADHNTFENAENVVEEKFEAYTKTNKGLNVVLPKCSVVMIRLEK